MKSHDTAYSPRCVTVGCRNRAGVRGNPDGRCLSCRKLKLRYPKTKRIKRQCLKCDEPFLAVGRFNRICSKCGIGNRKIENKVKDRYSFFGYGRMQKLWILSGQK